MQEGILAPSYYQLTQPINGLEEVLSSLNARGITSAKLRINDKFLLILKIGVRDISDFDKKTSNLKLRYFLFRNVDFKNLLKKADELDIRIRSIDIGEIEEEDLREELDQALASRDYLRYVDLVDKNDIIIKSIEVSYHSIIVKFYESGIVWVDTDIIRSEEGKSILKRVLTSLQQE